MKRSGIEIQMEGSNLVLSLNEPPGNYCNASMVNQLDAALDLAEKNPSLRGVVLRSKTPHFSFGLKRSDCIHSWNENDIAQTCVQWLRFLRRLETLNINSVALLEGRCESAGLELALACTWRIAAINEATEFSFPEIHWGLVPFGSGTYVLPRIIGLRSALNMLLKGCPINVPSALKLGLVDFAVPSHSLMNKAHQLLDSGQDHAQARRGRHYPKWSLESNSVVRNIIYAKNRDFIERETKGFYPAFYSMLDLIADTQDLSWEAAVPLISKTFTNLALSRQSQALLHLAAFDLQTTPLNQTPAVSSASVGFVGANELSIQLVTACANAGIRSVLFDDDPQLVGNALKQVHAMLADVHTGTHERQIFDVENKFVSPTNSSHGLENCSIVIHTTTDELEKRTRFLAEVSTNKAKVVIMTNASVNPIKMSIPADSVKDTVGMNTFRSHGKAPLAEIIVNDEVSSEACTLAGELIKNLGFKTILVKDSAGFFVNRIRCVYILEAVQNLFDGATIDHIDEALMQFGFTYGPFHLMDDIGIDSIFDILSQLARHFPNKLFIFRELKALITAGRLGSKTGRGLYSYDSGIRKDVDPQVYSLLRIKMNPNVQLTNLEVIDRCILAIVNESATCLEQEILENARDGDFATVHTIGFPPFWGGVFKYVDFVGPRIIVENLITLSRKYGDRFRPSPLLVKHADEGLAFFPDEPRKEIRG